MTFPSFGAEVPKSPENTPTQSGVSPKDPDEELVEQVLHEESERWQRKQEKERENTSKIVAAEEAIPETQRSSEHPPVFEGHAPESAPKQRGAREVTFTEVLPDIGPSDPRGVRTATGVPPSGERAVMKGEDDDEAGPKTMRSRRPEDRAA